MRLARRFVLVAMTLVAATGLGACGTSDEDQVRAAVGDFARSLEDKETERACALMTARAEAQLTSFLRAFGGTGDCALILKRLEEDEDGAGRLSQRAIDSARVAIRADLATLTPRRADDAVGLRKEDGGWRIDNVLNPSLREPARRGDPRLAHGSDERQIRATLDAFAAAITRKDYKRLCLFVSDGAEAQIFMASMFASLFDEQSDAARDRKDVDYSCTTAMRTIDALVDDEDAFLDAVPTSAELRGARVSVRDSHATVEIADGDPTEMIRVDGRWLIDADYDEPPKPAEYERCWRAAGAAIATRPADLRFADENDAVHYATGNGRVSVKGADWRIFYTLTVNGEDPGLGTILEDPSAATTAYVRNASEHRDVVVSARDCGTQG